MPTNPITPPPALVGEWQRTAPNLINKREHYHYITLCAAQWGADQELEACCEWMRSAPFGLSLNTSGNQLRAARRPKPPSLKEQALADLASMSIEPCLINDIDVNASVRAKYDTIRRALEALPE